MKQKGWVYEALRDALIDGEWSTAAEMMDTYRVSRGQLGRLLREIGEEFSVVWQRRQEGPPVHGVATEKSEADQALMTGMKSVLGYLRRIRNQVANLPEFKEQEALLELLDAQMTNMGALLGLATPKGEAEDRTGDSQDLLGTE